MEAITAERIQNGPFQSLRNFCERLSAKEVNKRTLENFIKAGAFDCFGATRKQLMQVYTMVLDQANRERASNMTGQMSLFDLLPEDNRKALEIQLPDVGEFADEEKLMFEREVTGIYISGHPLTRYEALWKKNITAASRDFQLDEETGQSSLQDGARVVVGGMITERTIKYTRDNKIMAFLTLEDLYGTVEIVVFPRNYEQSGAKLEEDARVFIAGRVSAEDDRASKVILERVIPFDEVPVQLWIQFANRSAYENAQQQLDQLLGVFRNDGKDEIIVYLREEKQMKTAAGHIQVTEDMASKMRETFGENNVKMAYRTVR